MHFVPNVFGKNLTSTGERFVDELRHLVEMQGNVGLRHVQQLQALVLDPEGFVELLQMNS